MSTMSKFLVVLAIICVAIVAGHKIVFTPRAYLEHRRCLRLTPGMEEREALKVMGKPQEELTRPSGERVLYYRWLFMDTGPIHVALGRAPGGYSVNYASCEGAG